MNVGKQNPLNTPDDTAYDDAFKSTVKIDNDVALASLIDDSYWRKIHISSHDGTVCSYRFENVDSNVQNNVYEIQISHFDNIQLGIYYGQYGKHLHPPNLS